MEQSDLKQHYQAASGLFRQGHFSQALALLDAVEQEMPNTQHVMWARAQCLQRLGRRDEALDVCGALITLFDDPRAMAMKQSLSPQSASASSRSEVDSAPKKGHRFLGIDMARTIAIFLMVIENYKNAMEAHNNNPGWLVWFYERMEGRAAPAFVTIMGAGLALLARNAIESPDSSLKWESTVRILKRGVFLVLVGILNFQIWPGDILHFYGFYMALCCLVLFTPSWTALVGAVVAMIVAYIINQTFDYRLGLENGWIYYNGYLTPRGFVRNTFLNGYHPVFPWVAYALVGVWLAKRPIFESDGRRLYLFIFLPLTLVMEIAMSQPGFIEFFKHPETGMPLMDGLLQGLVSRPNTLKILARTLVAICIILMCLELADRFEESRVVDALALTGQHSLTHYLAHTTIVLGIMQVMGILQQPRLTSFLIACGFCAGAIIFSILWSKKFKLGPLEAVMRKIAG